MTEKDITTQKTPESGVAQKNLGGKEDRPKIPFGRKGGGGGRQGGRRPEREKKDFDQKILNIRRVTRVVAGGRRFSFSVSMVIGDKKGRVGVGIGKAGDTSLAISKSIHDAKKKMITVPLTDSKSIPHEVSAKYCSARVFIQPTKGEKLVAGSSVRNVLELAGVRGANAKILSRSKNKLNNARAAILALTKIER
jgi:small subunit ribosomal protein S5